PAGRPPEQHPRGLDPPRRGGRADGGLHPALARRRVPPGDLRLSLRRRPPLPRPRLEGAGDLPDRDDRFHPDPLRHPPASRAMNTLMEGIAPLLDLTTVLCFVLGLLVGTLVGAFPGITGSMAVALASGFTLTLEPVQGLAVLLTIYVGANFGDRIPSILVNTPGTPASIATTFDGYPMAKQGKAGLALVTSAMVTAGGVLASMLIFIVAARPVAKFALNFGPAEMFALVVFGLTIMISISSTSILKGVLAG